MVGDVQWTVAKKLIDLLRVALPGVTVTAFDPGDEREAQHVWIESIVSTDVDIPTLRNPAQPFSQDDFFDINLAFVVGLEADHDATHEAVAKIIAGVNNLTLDDPTFGDQFAVMVAKVTDKARRVIDTKTAGYIGQGGVVVNVHARITD